MRWSILINNFLHPGRGAGNLTVIYLLVSWSGGIHPRIFHGVFWKLRSFQGQDFAAVSEWVGFKQIWRVRQYIPLCLKSMTGRLVETKNLFFGRGIEHLRGGHLDGFLSRQANFQTNTRGNALWEVEVFHVLIILKMRLVTALNHSWNCDRFYRHLVLPSGRLKDHGVCLKDS